MADSMESAREMVSGVGEEPASCTWSARAGVMMHASTPTGNSSVEQIGALGILNSDFYIGAHFGGFRDEMASVLLLDMAIHTLDARPGTFPARTLSRSTAKNSILRLELVQG